MVHEDKTSLKYQFLSWGGNPKKENLPLKLFIITGQPKAQNLQLLSGIEQDSI